MYVNFSDGKIPKLLMIQKSAVNSSKENDPKMSSSKSLDKLLPKTDSTKTSKEDKYIPSSAVRKNEGKPEANKNALMPKLPTILPRCKKGKRCHFMSKKYLLHAFVLIAFKKHTSRKYDV